MISSPTGARLRALVHIDRMGPQYAAYWALMAQGSLPVAGMSQLLIEVSPSSLVFPVGDAAFKACAVQSAGTLVERDFGLVELHAGRTDTVLEARDAVLRALGLRVSDRQVPEVISTVARFWKTEPPTVVPDGPGRWSTRTVCSKVLPS